MLSGAVPQLATGAQTQLARYTATTAAAAAATSHPTGCTTGPSWVQLQLAGRTTVHSCTCYAAAAVAVCIQATKPLSNAIYILQCI